MSSIARWNVFAEFERLARLSDEDYRRAAALGIEKQEEKQKEESRKRREKIHHSLDRIAYQVVHNLTDREYYHHALKDWCEGFRSMLEATIEPEWNPWDCEPNYEILSTILEEVGSKSTKDKVGTLFETSFRSGKNSPLKSKYQIETIKAKLKTPLEGRQAILEDFFNNLKRPYLGRTDFVRYAAIDAWIKAVKPMFESGFNHQNDWDKLLFLIDTISQQTDTSILNERNEIRAAFDPARLPPRLGIDYRADPRVPQERTRRRDRFNRLNPFTSHSLAQHRRIGRRQATIRGIETFGEARDGGLLLA